MDGLRSFSNNLRRRYDDDIMINIPLAILIILSPLIYHHIMNTYLADRYYDIVYDINTFDWVVYVVTGCMVVTVFYVMYGRLMSHAKRDRGWRESLIEFANSKYANTDALKEKHHEIEGMDHFRMLILLRISAVMSVAGTYSIVVFGSLHYAQQLSAVFAGPVTAMIATLPTLIRYPPKHEVAQIEFTNILKDTLINVGVVITPMPVTIVHKSIKENLKLTAMTLGLYLVYFIAKRLISDMNTHMRYQHSYERVLLQQLQGKQVALDTDRQGRIVRMRKKPYSLMIAELFLLVVCLTYLTRIYGLALDIRYGHSGYTIIDDPQLEAYFNYFIAFLDICLMMLTVQAALGIKSGRIKSWRKVIRSCLVFVFMFIPQMFVYMNNSYTHLFNFNPHLTLVAVYGIVLMMMLSVPIKRYYTPVGEKIPPLPSWIRYVFFGELFDDGDPDKGLIKTFRRSI